LFADSTLLGLRIFLNRFAVVFTSPRQVRTFRDPHPNECQGSSHQVH
jgi:hypothetical protein